MILTLTTDLDGNPAFTVYDVDPDTYDIMDVKVYICKFYRCSPECYRLSVSTLANMTLPNYHVKREQIT